jgi:hypothetical protein
MLKQYQKAHNSDRRRLKIYGMFKLMYNWKSRLVIRKAVKRLALRQLKRYVRREVKLRRRIRYVTISRGMTKLYKRVNIASQHDTKALQIIQSKVFSLKLLLHKTISKAVRYLRKKDGSVADNNEYKAPKKLSNKKKIHSDMQMVANQIHFSIFCRQVFKRLHQLLLLLITILLTLIIV